MEHMASGKRGEGKRRGEKKKKNVLGWQTQAALDSALLTWITHPLGSLFLFAVKHPGEAQLAVFLCKDRSN